MTSARLPAKPPQVANFIKFDVVFLGRMMCEKGDNDTFCTIMQKTLEKTEEYCSQCLPKFKKIMDDVFKGADAGVRKRRTNSLNKALACIQNVDDAQTVQRVGISSSSTLQVSVCTLLLAIAALLIQY
jgi:hypothetical protein